MYTCEFTGSEGGVLPVNGVTYRQVGLLINPQVYGSGGPVLANGAIYNTTTQLSLSAGAGNIFSPDELAIQTDQNQNVLFSGTVVSFDPSTNILQLINTTGTPTIGLNIIGSYSGASRTVFNVSSSSLIPFSGFITYIENRPGVQRSSDSIEQFRFVISY
jgi:hypothetical protein